MESEAAMDITETAEDRKPLEKTRALMAGVLERINLLLQVTIATQSTTKLTRSVSTMPDAHKGSELLSVF